MVADEAERLRCIQQALDEGWYKPNLNDGYCHCGCGLKAPIATRTGRANGCFKGEPQRFLLGHRAKKVDFRADLASRRRQRGHSVPVADVRGTYNSWHAMKRRCLDEDYDQWSDYGGRGITVCKRWMVFDSFLADMGERPEWATGGIDRIDNAGDYELANCRWATRWEQAQNRRPPAPSGA